MPNSARTQPRAPSLMCTADANLKFLSTPYTPQIMEGATLVQPDAALDAVPISALEQLANKVTLLYFSASWCPPCRNFTPKLVAAVKALKEAGRNLEAVFVTGDRGESAWKEYHSHMNFPALPFSDEKRRSELDM